MRKRFAALAAACAFMATAPAIADEFPTKPVTLMMPYAAGGPGDVITRIAAYGMGKALNQQFLVENVAGASGTIGTAKVAAATPDGYSLLVMHFGHAVNVALFPNLRYHPVNDFEPIGIISESPMAIVAKKDFPANSFAEMLAYLKANQSKVTYGFAGIGSASHMCGLLFFNATGIKVGAVPYKGTGPALSDLIGGQFDFMCDQTLNVMPPVNSGMIKAYAVTMPERLAVAPNVPTANEAGLPNFNMSVWFAMWAPKGTPKPVIEKLSKALQQALRDPEVKERLAKSGAEPTPQEKATPEALRTLLKAEIDRWVPIVKQAGVTAQ